VVVLGRRDNESLAGLCPKHQQQVCSVLVRLCSDGLPSWNFQLLASFAGFLSDGQRAMPERREGQQPMLRVWAHEWCAKPGVSPP